MKWVHKKEKAFTLVETLVALAIFLLAVSGPIYAISQGISTGLLIKDRTTARYLAQEGVELVRSYRDGTALINQAAKRAGGVEIDWLTQLPGCTSLYGCFMSSIDAPVQCPTDGCPVMLQSGSTGRYQYQTGGLSKFTRTISVIEVINGVSASVQVDVSWRPRPLLPLQTVSIQTWMYNWTSDPNTIF